MRDEIRVAAALGATLAALAAAAPAAAAERCRAPDSVGHWRSCVSAAHVALPDGDRVSLERVTATLVVRDADCASQPERRRITIRTAGGRRIAAGRTDGRCRRGVARYRAILRPHTKLRKGAAITADWSGIDELGRPAKARLE